MREITITANLAGQRLDKFLTKYMDQANKSFFYKMMRKKNIVLNGKKCQGKEILQLGDSVKLFLAEDTIEKFATNVIQKTKVSLDIIYENEHMIFINKPAGMLSQKAEKSDESVVEHVITYLLESGQLKEEDLQAFRPSVCNRLDRNTSGLITAGKSLHGLQLMSKYFAERTMEKYYLTLVAGEVKKEEHLKGYLVKDEKTNKVSIHSESSDEASYIETSYKPLAHKGEISLLEIHLITGKPHQIRAHLASVGHGIIGDSKYGSKKVNAIYREKYGVKHQLLHAYKLVFPKNLNEIDGLAGESFFAPLGREFKRVLKEELSCDRLYSLEDKL